MSLLPSSGAALSSLTCVPLSAVEPSYLAMESSTAAIGNSSIPASASAPAQQTGNRAPWGKERVVGVEGLGALVAGMWMFV